MSAPLQLHDPNAMANTLFPMSPNAMRSACGSPFAAKGGSRVEALKMEAPTMPPHVPSPTHHLRDTKMNRGSVMIRTTGPKRTAFGKKTWHPR